MRKTALAFACLATPALSCGVGQWEVFDCTLSDGKKQLRVCSTEEAANYSFAVPGQSPEIELFEPIDRLDYRPWNGVGRTLFEDATFNNESYSYSVYSVFDRLTEGAMLEGGVVVKKDDVEIAHLRCDPGSVSARLDLFYEFKARVGQCWNHQDFTWGTDCPTN